MSEIFRIRIEAPMAVFMDRKALKGAWEAAVLEQGGQIIPGGVTVRHLPSGAATVAGLAERP
jgi:hypothetical protein